MNVGIVLSGGMAKGAYQLGALKAISKYLPPSDISCISCSSVGVLNGYAYLSDELDKAENLWKTLCNNNNRILINRLLRSTLLQDKIDEIYNPKLQINIPFYCTLADFNGKNVIYKNLSNVSDKSLPLYLKASVAMPLYNKAVKIDGRPFYDGAMLDNIPVYPLYRKNIDYLICVYFDNARYRFENIMFDNRIIKIHFPTDGSVSRAVVFRQESIEEMIDEGYDRASYILDSIFLNGVDDIESIYSNIEKSNKYGEKRKLRVTGDMIIKNINKATKRFLKQKIV